MGSDLENDRRFEVNEGDEDGEVDKSSEYYCI